MYGSQLLLQVCGDRRIFVVPCSRLLIAAGVDQTVRLWNYELRRQELVKVRLLVFKALMIPC